MFNCQSSAGLYRERAGTSGGSVWMELLRRVRDKTV